MTRTHQVGRAGRALGEGNSGIGYTATRPTNGNAPKPDVVDFIDTGPKLRDGARNKGQERNGFGEHGSRCDDAIDDL
jgi:hypothetical protein